MAKRTIASYFSRPTPNFETEKTKRSKTEVKARMFLDSWLNDFEWLRYDNNENIMYCEFCRNCGSTLAGSTEFVQGSNKFKRENIRAHA